MKALDIKQNPNSDSMNTKKNKTKDWQSFLALEPLDEDLPRIRDNGETRDPFCGWNAGKATEK